MYLAVVLSASRGDRSPQTAPTCTLGGLALY
jgi:hypothetical protein